MPLSSPGAYAEQVPSPTRIARTRGGHVWGEVWRVLAALAFGLLIWTVAAAVPADEQPASAPAIGITPSWIWWDLVIGVACSLLLLVRRRHHLAVAVVANALTVVSLASTGAASIALISLATTRRWRAIAATLAVAVVAGAAQFKLYRGIDRGPLWSELVIGGLALGFSVAVGFYIGERRAFVASLHERALTAEREQSMRVVQARVGERARIAREMHDVLAHRISLVAMHSGALTFRKDLSPEEVAEAAEVIRSNANLALSELRAVLGVLRDVDGPRPRPAETGAPEPPQPTLAELDTLVAESGVDVDVQVTGPLDEVPDTVSRNAFRIVQECLTNARKHAPDQRVHLQLEVLRLPDELRLQVRNPMAATPGTVIEGAGLGLLGLTERAVLTGGELSYGPDRRGDFVVSARLPWSR